MFRPQTRNLLEESSSNSMNPCKSLTVVFWEAKKSEVSDPTWFKPDYCTRKLRSETFC